MPVRRDVTRLRNFVDRDLWTLDPTRLGTRLLVQVARLAVLVVEGFRRDDLLIRAAALTYKVVFALVPLLAVMLAIFKGFGGLASAAARVKTFLLRHLTPELGQQVTETLDRLVEQVNAAAIGAVGFAILIWTAFSLLGTMERAFNTVWGIRKPRPLFLRMGVYWIFITISPILLLFSISAGAFIQSQLLTQWLYDRVPLLNAVVLVLSPFMFTWIGFTCLYLFMPNARVFFRSACVGALVAGTLWEILKSLYVLYNAKIVVTYQLYGSLGAIPVFLLWVYISWIVVLLGAEIAFAVQHLKTYRREIQTDQVSYAFRERLALGVMLEIAGAFLRGEPPPGASILADRLNVPIRLLNEVVEVFEREKLVRALAADEKREPPLVPAKDPEAISVQHVLAALRRHGVDPSPQPDGKESLMLLAILGDVESITAQALSRRNFKELSKMAT